MRKPLKLRAGASLVAVLRQRLRRIEHAVRPDRQTRGAQYTREVHHVLCEAAVRCHFPVDSRSSVSITTLTLLAPTLIGALKP